MIKIKKLSSCIAVLTALGSISSAAAQSNDEQKPKKSSLQESMEVISVTARRKEENLQTTPIAISAFSGDGLEARGFQEM